MEIVVAWLVLSVLVAVLADARGRSGVGFFLMALSLSPLVAFVWVMVALGGKKCPHCAERIKREARVCRYCGNSVPHETVVAEALNLGRRERTLWAVAIAVGALAVLALFEALRPTEPVRQGARPQAQPQASVPGPGR
jgi:hypothetical protein